MSNIFFFNSFDICQYWRFFSPCIYWYKDTKEAMDVAVAIPICPRGPINSRFNIKFDINTIALYFTGVLVSPLAKKFGIRAFTIT